MLLHDRAGRLFCWNGCVHDQQTVLQSQRDILHRSFDNLGVSPLKEPVLNASRGDVVRALRANARRDSCS